MDLLGASHERLYRRLLRCYPAAFRARFGDEMVQLFGDQLRDARTGNATGGVAGTWLRTLGDLATTVVAEQARRDRTMAHSLAAPTRATRALGILGIVGGAILVAAFIPFIPWSPDVFNLRLVLLNAGAMAIVIAVHRRQAPVAPTLSLLAVVPVLLANAWHVVMIVGIVAKPGPPGVGDYPPPYAWSQGAVWLTGAWFGLVALRLRAVTRWGALALTIGSVLTIFPGMSPLVRGPYGSILTPIALAGIGLIGIGWIVMGLDVALRRRPAPAS